MISNFASRLCFKSTIIANFKIIIMTLFLMMYCLVFSRMMLILSLMMNSLILSLMMDYLIPSLLIYYPYLFIFSRFIHNPLILSLCWMLDLLCPSRRVHDPDKAVTNRCFLYRNKRGKVRIISRNNADTA